jgi:hypothetical protein
MVASMQGNSIVTLVCRCLGVLYISSCRQVSGQGGRSCSATSCADCLTTGCVWMTVDSDGSEINDCLEYCSAFPKAPCYDTQSFLDAPMDVSIEGICSFAVTDVPDLTTCRTALDCSSCVNTIKSDGTSTCSWYSDGNYCGSGRCTSFGCGSGACDGYRTSTGTGAYN